MRLEQKSRTVSAEPRRATRPRAGAATPTADIRGRTTRRGGRGTPRARGRALPGADVPTGPAGPGIPPGAPAPTGPAAACLPRPLAPSGPSGAGGTRRAPLAPARVVPRGRLGRGVRALPPRALAGRRSVQPPPRALVPGGALVPGALVTRGSLVPRVGVLVGEVLDGAQEGARRAPRAGAWWAGVSASGGSGLAFEDPPESPGSSVDPPAWGEPGGPPRVRVADAAARGRGGHLDVRAGRSPPPPWPTPPLTIAPSSWATRSRAAASSPWAPSSSPESSALSRSACDARDSGRGSAPS